MNAADIAVLWTVGLLLALLFMSGLAWFVR